MSKRPRKRAPKDFERDCLPWVLRLDSPSGQSGYFAAVSADGVMIRETIDGLVLRYPSRKAAENGAKWLGQKYGISRDEIAPEQTVHDRVKSLWLGKSEWPDGMSVEVNGRSGKRFLLLRESSEEQWTDDLDEEVADMLVRILHKLESCLKTAG